MKKGEEGKNIYEDCVLQSNFVIFKKIDLWGCDLSTDHLANMSKSYDHRSTFTPLR